MDYLAEELDLTLPMPGGEQLQVLIADDSATDRLLLSKILQRLGCLVTEAVDGAQAVECFRRDHPKLVFMDVLMPVMDGFEAANRIKQLAGERLVPIIFISSLQEPEALALSVNAGGDSYLTKPYSEVTIRAKLKAYTRMALMHETLLEQRDKIASLNERLIQEQEVAKRVFDKVAHAGCLDAPNIRYALSPIAVFNGDVALAGVGPSGNLLVMLGDFTGHGLSAAIGAMPMAQAFYSMLDKGFGLKPILREINLKLDEILPVGVFCCAVMAEFDFVGKFLRVWNGGLPGPILFRNNSRSVERVHSRHLPLGIRTNTVFDDSVETFQIDIDDRLLLFTDGILESEGDHGEMFGEERLLQVFADNREPERLFSEINLAVNSYLGEGKVNDDISLIEVRVVEPADFSFAKEQFFGYQEAGPRDWSLRYELRPETLKVFDPLPLMLHVLQQVPFLRPMMGQIYTVMAELYSNALEHGVLGLDSALKNSPDGFQEYYHLRGQRLTNLDRGRVELALHYTGDLNSGRLAIDVEDSGDGFNYQQFLVDDPAALPVKTSYSGRGIHLLQSLCESIRFYGCGNRVQVVFSWGQAVDAGRELG